MKKTMSLLCVASFGLLACQTSEPLAKKKATSEPTFGDDVAFLNQHTTIHVLKNSTGARAAVAPAWQGRVMTSSTAGDDGFSQGWIHRDNVITGIQPEGERKGLAQHIHVFGGEERLWLGPEGGQYAIFFPPGTKDYVFAAWKTPALIDTEAFEVTAQSDSAISMRKTGRLQNVSGAVFDVELNRTVELLEPDAIQTSLGVNLPSGLKVTGYRSTNQLKNVGAVGWKAEQGTLSLWLLGMFKHGPHTTVVIPLEPGAEPSVNSDYFGVPDATRLRVKGNTVFFKGDGAFRSKIGIPPLRAKNLAASYDADRHILTVIRFNLPAQAAQQPYLRAQWKNHEHPYAGDVINAYNDGAPAPDQAPLGPFYELESSSPAPALAPGAVLTHTQETIHGEGTEAALNELSLSLLHLSLNEINAAF